MQAKIGGFPGEVVASGYQDIVGELAASRVAKEITLSEAYDPTKYYPRVVTHAEIYPADGGTAPILNPYTYWQDFTNSKIKVWTHCPNSSHGDTYRFYYEVYKKPPGSLLYQAAHDIAVNTGVTTPDEVDITLTSSLRSDTKHCLINPFIGKSLVDYSGGTTGGYTSYGNGLRVGSKTTVKWSTTYKMGHVSGPEYRIPVVIIH